MLQENRCVESEKEKSCYTHGDSDGVTILTSPGYGPLLGSRLMAWAKQQL